MAVVVARFPLAMASIGIKNAAVSQRKAKTNKVRLTWLPTLREEYP